MRFDSIDGKGVLVWSKKLWLRIASMLSHRQSMRNEKPSSPEDYPDAECYVACMF